MTTDNLLQQSMSVKPILPPGYQQHAQSNAE